MFARSLYGAPVVLALTGCAALPPTYTVTRGPVFQTYQDTTALVVYPANLSLNCPPATALVAGQISFKPSTDGIYYRVVVSNPSGGPRQAYESPAETSADAARRAVEDMASGMGVYLLAERNPDCSPKAQEASWDATFRVEDQKGQKTFSSPCRINGGVSNDRGKAGEPRAYIIISVVCDEPSVEPLRSPSRPLKPGGAPSSSNVIPPQPLASVYQRLPTALTGPA